MYKVRIVPPTSEREIKKWVSVEDSGYLMSKAEKEKRAKQEKKRKLKQLREELYIPMTRYDRYESFSSMGYSVVYNPKGDGSCQFEALCYWLERLGIYRSGEILRDEAVKYLAQHPYNADGDPLKYFAAIP